MLILLIMNILNISLNMFIAYLICCCIGPTPGFCINECLHCGGYVECKGSTDSVLANDYDTNLVKPRDFGEIRDKSLTDCVPKHLKLIGIVNDHICFQQPACWLVVNNDIYTTGEPTEREKKLCNECNTFCGCKPLKLDKVLKKRKSGAESTISNIIVFNGIIIISLYT